MTCVCRLALTLAVLNSIFGKIRLLRMLVIMYGQFIIADVHSAVVSGWRLIDGAPYWAPKLGQEGLLNKVLIHKSV